MPVQMLDRECGRERALEKAEKEAKARARREAARAAEPITRVTADDLEKVSCYFRRVVFSICISR